MKWFRRRCRHRFVYRDSYVGHPCMPYVKCRDCGEPFPMYIEKNKGIA